MEHSPSCCPVAAISLINICENSNGLPAPHWALSQALTTMLDLFQAWLLEQSNDAATTLGKNLEMESVSNGHLERIVNKNRLCSTLR